VLALVLFANVWLPRKGAKWTTVLAGIESPTLVRYDSWQRRFEPFLGGASIDGVDTSRDGRWIAYTTYPTGELWRANADGSEPRRLTSAPLRAALPRWSPDGTRIAFAAHAPSRPWQVHIIPAEGGPIEVLAPENVVDPGWRPDGRAIVLGTLSNAPGPIFEWDLASGRRTIVPGSHGLFSPRPSPDGRYLAALDVKTWQIAILDQGTGQWSRCGPTGVGYPAWTRDGSWLTFRREGSFGRIDPATGREEPIAALEGAVPVGGDWGAWSGLAPDGSPAILVTRDPLSG
jgi:Tol biopolymer transport system component